jgi:hypothetical protein
VVSIVEPEPKFTARIASDQISQLPETGSDVVITGPSSVWHARTGSMQIDDSGASTLTFTSAEGGSICGDECDTLDYGAGPVALKARIVVTPEITGPAVPMSALGAAANGDVFVLDATGHRVVVDVMARNGSLAVVSGIGVGEVVRLFAMQDQGLSTENPSESGHS